MPQMDIMQPDSTDGKASLSVGWDDGDQSFLFLYAREKGKHKQRGYTTVRLNEREISELKLFLANHYGDD